MFAIDWENPRPQTDEHISKVIWADPANVKDYLSNTYPSIKMLVKKYLSSKE